ncbi:MAG: hypothetical protein L0228_00915 [Planctomycetes bacterium]|nr:hypothetical protein [Planctomycetota bacterium]
MARKFRIAAVGSITAAALLVAVLGSAYYAAQQVQPFYKQALEVQPEVLVRGSRELESRATALYSDARQQGQWHALFTAEQINGWLATQLAANQDRELPTNIRDPRVAIAKDLLTLGFSTKSGGVDTVVTVDASVFLTAEGSVAIRLMSVRAGALPLPVMRLADELAAGCKKLSLPVRWTQQDGEPVALVELHSDPASDKPQFYIDTIELGESELYVAGHTELAKTSVKHAPPGVGRRESVNTAIVLEDYELRLTPRHKDGALQIARRTVPDDADDAKSSER